MSRARALFVERVEHAPRTITVWLLHLLRPYVYSPPEGSDHGEVIVVDIFDKTSALISWVRFNIDPLESFGDVHIPEGNISNTIAASVGGHTANSHTDSENNSRVLNEHVLCAVSSHITFVAGLGYNDIVKVLDC